MGPARDRTKTAQFNFGVSQKRVKETECAALLSLLDQALYHVMVSLNDNYIYKA